MRVKTEDGSAGSRGWLAAGRQMAMCQQAVTDPISDQISRSDVREAAGSRLLRTHCIPDQPTALRDDARKLGRARLTSDDSEGHTIELVELDCRGRQWTLPYNLGPGDAEDRHYEIKLATAFVVVTLCLYQPPRST
jgi:hypothetical protein